MFLSALTFGPATTLFAIQSFFEWKEIYTVHVWLQHLGNPNTILFLVCL